MEVDFSPLMVSASAAVRRLPVSRTSQVCDARSVLTSMVTRPVGLHDRGEAMLAVLELAVGVEGDALWVSCQSPRFCESRSACRWR
jgi:hypothetical protein